MSTLAEYMIVSGAENLLDEEQLAFLTDPRITDCHDVQPTIIHNASFQTNDLHAYDSDCDDISSAKVVLMVNLSSYNSNILSELAFLADPRITDCHDVQPTIIHNAAFQTNDLHAYDSDCDDISSAKAVLMVNLSSYNSNILSEVPQPDTYQNNNMINQSFDNGLHNKLNDVKTAFNQMEAAVEHCSVDKKYFDIQTKEIFLDNDRLLEHIIFQDVMNIVMHVDSVLVNVLYANNERLVHDNLEIERLEQENEHLFELLLSQDIVHIFVNSLATLTIMLK
nr:hypothetical protein [Tanacetum cinerariifolium]